jgi:hypothetical protein
MPTASVCPGDVMRTPVLRAALVLVFGALAPAACQHPGDEAVVVPHEQPPPPQTSDGRVVGADDKPPAHLLAEQGTTSHAAPGWKVNKKGVSYDPKRRAEPADEGGTHLEHPDGGTEAVPEGPPRKSE